MLVVSVFSCLLILYALFFERHLHRNAAILIIHNVFIELKLTLVDFSLFVHNVVLVFNGGMVDPSFCAVTQYMYWSTVSVWHWDVFALAVNRFAAMFLPHIYGRLTRKLVLVFGILAAWVIGFAVNVPLYIRLSGTFGVVGPLGVCHIKTVRSFVAVAIQASLSMYVPLTAAVVLYLSIFVKVYLTTPHIISPVNGTVALASRANASRKRRMKVTQVLFLSVLCYLVCFILVNCIRAWNNQLIRRSALAQLWISSLPHYGCAWAPVNQCCLFFWSCSWSQLVSFQLTMFVASKEYRGAVVRLLRKITWPRRAADTDRIPSEHRRLSLQNVTPRRSPATRCMNFRMSWIRRNRTVLPFVSDHQMPVSSKAQGETFFVPPVYAPRVA